MKRLVAVLMLVAAGTGCRDDVITVGTNRLPGTYLLATFNGGSLPASLGTRDGESTSLIFGSLVLNEDGTCSKSETVIHTRTSGISRTEATVSQCYYQIVVGTDRLALDVQGGTFLGAAFGNNVVQVEELATVREYRRQ